MAIANKYLTEELYELTIGEILVTDLETGIEMASGSLKSSNVNKTATTTDIRAGRDNVQFLEIVGDSEVSVEVVDIQAKRDWMALKLGGQLETKEIEIEAFPKNYKVSGTDAKEITLDQTPITGQTVAVYNKKTNAVVTTTLSGNKITITDETVNKGDVLYVGSYKYSVEAEAISIPASSEGRDVAITITRPVCNAKRKVVYEKVYKFHRASLGTDFTDENTSEKSEGAISTSFKILKHTDYEDLGFLAYIKVNQ